MITNKHYNEIPWFKMQFPKFLKKKRLISPDCPWFENRILKLLDLSPDFPKAGHTDFTNMANRIWYMTGTCIQYMMKLYLKYLYRNQINFIYQSYCQIKFSH